LVGDQNTTNWLIVGMVGKDTRGHASIFSKREAERGSDIRERGRVKPRGCGRVIKGREGEGIWGGVCEKPLAREAYEQKTKIERETWG